MKSHLRKLFLVCSSTALLLPSSAAGQIRASERGIVAQTIDGTKIVLDYGRPQVRGRTGLFGGEVPWGKTWTPGANWATTIQVDKDITIDGHSLTAGKYSMWLQVQEQEWTAIFDPGWHRFHLFAPPVSDQQLRFAVQPTEGRHIEILTWSFPVVRATGATLQLAWADTRVSFDVAVQPTHPVTVDADFGARFVGTYSLALRPPLGNDVVDFEIRYENDRLVAHWPAARNPLLVNTWLVPLGAGMFAPAELKDGELFDIVMDLVLEFTPLEGQATKFEMRALGDELWGTGEKR